MNLINLMTIFMVALFGVLAGAVSVVLSQILVELIQYKMEIKKAKEQIENLAEDQN